MQMAFGRLLTHTKRISSAIGCSACVRGARPNVTWRWGVAVGKQAQKWRSSSLAASDSWRSRSNCCVARRCTARWVSSAGMRDNAKASRACAIQSYGHVDNEACSCS